MRNTEPRILPVSPHKTGTCMLSQPNLLVPSSATTESCYYHALLPFWSVAPMFMTMYLLFLHGGNAPIQSSCCPKVMAATPAWKLLAKTPDDQGKTFCMKGTSDCTKLWSVMQIGVLVHLLHVVIFADGCSK